MSTERSVRRDGLVIITETDRRLPLVDIEVALRTGATADPRKRDGLARLLWRVARMGTRDLHEEEVDARVSGLGARFQIDVGTTTTRVTGAVLARNLEAFLAILGGLLRAPALRADDLARARREAYAHLVAARDDDRGLAAMHFRRALFEGQPQARSAFGSKATLAGLGRADLVRHHARHLVAGNVVVGAAGDVDHATLAALLDRHFAPLAHRAPPETVLPEPKRRRGRHVVVVDKPERSQTQVFVGTLGGKIGDPDLDAFHVANMAFGGTMTARLMQEVRVKRGWSYGAYSRLGADRTRDAWSMWTFPAAKDVTDCIRLELDLLDAVVDRGLRPKEYRVAQNALVNSHCFDLDTAQKRLDPHIEEEIFDIPRGWHAKYIERIRGVGLEDANSTLRRRLDPRHLVIALVATAKDVVPALERLPGVSTMTVVDHRQGLP